MPITKSSRVNQRNREVVMAEIHRPLPAGCRVGTQLADTTRQY